jgi:hypothetical protein
MTSISESSTSVKYLSRSHSYSAYNQTSCACSDYLHVLEGVRKFALCFWIQIKRNAGARVEHVEDEKYDQNTRAHNKCCCHSP